MLYAVTCVQLPAKAIELFSKDEFLSLVKKELLTKTKGKVLSDKTVKIDGYSGSEVVAEIFGGEAVMHMRLVMIEDHIYLLVVLHPADGGSPEDVQRFWESFRFIETR
jgi:hypothetical protein